MIFTLDQQLAEIEALVTEREGVDMFEATTEEGKQQ